MTAAPTVTKARFENADGTGSDAFDVMFNPASLKVSVTNKLQEEQSGGDDQERQQTRTTTTKLEMELVFDTTETGGDVRGTSDADSQGTKRLKDKAIVADNATTAPPRIRFVWGRFAYEGVIESLNETLEFWSAEGVPLRATVQLVMSGVGGADTIARNAPDPAAVVTAPEGGFGATEVARQAGDDRAGRQVAAANGLENMRMTGGGALAVGGGVSLKAAAGFKASAGAGFGGGIGAGASAGAGGSLGFGFGAKASAGAGFGASAGAGFGSSAGAGFGASAGAGFGASAGASAGASFGATAGAGFGASAGSGFSASAGTSSSGSLFGGSASAGVTASAGAFAGLGKSTTFTTTHSLNPQKLLPPPVTPVVTSGSSFDVTGKVLTSGSAGLTANVNGREVLRRETKFG